MWNKKLKKYPVISPLTGLKYKVKIKPYRLFWSITGYEVLIFEKNDWLCSGSEFFSGKPYDFISMTGIAIINYEEKTRRLEREKQQKMRERAQSEQSKTNFKNWNGRWKTGVAVTSKEED